MKYFLAGVMLLFGGVSLAQTLATVGTTGISAQEFNQKLEEVRKQGLNPSSPEEFLEDLVRFEVGVLEAEKLKLANDPIVKERFKQLLYNTLLERQLGKKIEELKVSEKELREFNKKNPDLRIAHILIEVKPNSDTATKDSLRKRANEILSEVKKSKQPFEDFARQYSDDAPSKESGGDIGFQSRASLLPTLYDAALNMKSGEIHGLIETTYGYHILKLIERRSFDLTDKRLLHKSVFEEKRIKIFDEYFEKLKKQYKIKVNKDALKALRP